MQYQKHALYADFSELLGLWAEHDRYWPTWRSGQQSENRFILLRQFRRHCEEQGDEAIQNDPRRLDCSAALAMTRRVSP
jgi:hypothetical protein